VKVLVCESGQFIEWIGNLLLLVLFLLFLLFFTNLREVSYFSPYILERALECKTLEALGPLSGSAGSQFLLMLEHYPEETGLFSCPHFIDCLFSNLE